MNNNILNVRPSGIPRSVFSGLSHTVKSAFNAGELVPMGKPILVLPGDHFKISVNSFIRMTPTVNVPLDNIYMNVWLFYVPFRIIWNHWKEFVGENTNDPWTASTTYRIPRITFPNETISGASVPVKTNLNSILRHMGVSRVNIINSDGTGDSWINALPVRAYNLCWNEYFRDINYQYPILFEKGDNTVTYSTTNQGASGNWQSAATGNELLPLNRIPDYFSCGIPDPSFGPDVRIPTDPSGKILIGANGATTNINIINSSYALGAVSPTTSPLTLNPAILPTIEQFRIAYLTQQYQYALGIFGTRYQEIINALFGVEPSNSEVDRPLLVGYYNFPLNISPVIQTSASQDVSIDSETVFSPKGDVSGYSATRKDSFLCSSTFREHGLLLPLYGVRLERSYSQGLDKMWRQSSFLDFYNKFFDEIGPQAIMSYELSSGVGNSISNNAVWCYSEPWLDYKLSYNQVVGPLSEGNYLEYWTLADHYNSLPVFSAGWLAEGYENLNRTLAVPSEYDSTSFIPQFLGDFYLDIVATRSMKRVSMPNLAGRL